ncbi:HAMP domain-containing sensor histidine kinase [soil metagenome]
MGRTRINSVRYRLLLLFFAITAAAIGFVYLYLVPQLRSNLTAEKLRRLEASSGEQTQRLESLLRSSPSQVQLRREVRRLSQRADGRLTLLGIRNDGSGVAPAFVVSDSEVERTALQPGYPAARAAVSNGGVATAVERVGGEPLGETAMTLSDRGGPKWVAVLSTPLDDVDDSVGLIQRQILIAGLIALAAALAAAWFAARGHARRLLALEQAAENVANGDLSTPIPVDSGDEVGQLAATLNEMRERLARLDSARKEFIANASHELRTPIFSLGGFAELLDEDDPDPELRAEFVRTMREQIERLKKLTTDRRDLSKLDADALALNRTSFDLAELGEKVANEFRALLEHHRSTVSRPASGGAVADADPHRAAQIIRILIDNALTHTPEGTAITLTTNSADGLASLVVRDDGPGIEPSARGRVFERFFTGDEVGGSGLGLAIARELARLMDGELTLASHRGRTEFTLNLPAAGAHA